MAATGSSVEHPPAGPDAHNRFHRLPVAGLTPAPATPSIFPTPTRRAIELPTRAIVRARTRFDARSHLSAQEAGVSPLRG